MKVHFKKLIRIHVAAAFGFASVACEVAKVKTQDLRTQASEHTIPIKIQSIEHSAKLKSQLPNPFKLAIYFKSPRENFNWSASDKLNFIKIADDLKIHGLVSDVIVLDQVSVDLEKIDSIRKMGGAKGADALLLVEGGAAIERSINPWGWSYILLLPTLFIKGSKAETFFTATATLWSVKEDTLITAAEAEANHRESYIAVFGASDRKLIDRTKNEALENLNTELKRIFKGTRIE